MLRFVVYVFFGTRAEGMSRRRRPRSFQSPIASLRGERNVNAVRGGAELLGESRRYPVYVEAGPRKTSARFQIEFGGGKWTARLRSRISANNAFGFASSSHARDNGIFFSAATRPTRVSRHQRQGTKTAFHFQTARPPLPSLSSGYGEIETILHGRGARAKSNAKWVVSRKSYNRFITTGWKW